MQKKTTRDVTKKLLPLLLVLAVVVGAGTSGRAGAVDMSVIKGTARNVDMCEHDREWRRDRHRRDERRHEHHRGHEHDRRHGHG
jgi:ribosomal protein S9